MSTAAFGIPLALVTTSAFNTGLILEKRALTRMPALNLRQVGRTIVSLLSSPAWLTGFSLMLAGLACQVVLLTFEPISLVQPILASGVALTLVLSRLVLRERLGGAESWCVAALAVSIVLLAFSQDTAKGDTTRQPGVLPLVAVIAPSIAAGLLITTGPRWGHRGRRVRRGTTATALCAGLGVGLLYGVGALMTKGLSRLPARDHTAVSLGLGLASSPYLYLLVGCSAAALLLYQGALQVCRASILIPVSNVVSSAYFVIAGTWLFHERLPADPVSLALRLAGIAAAGLVLVALFRQPVGPPPQATHPERPLRLLARWSAAGEVLTRGPVGVGPGLRGRGGEAGVAFGERAEQPVGEARGPLGAGVYAVGAAVDFAVPQTLVGAAPHRAGVERAGLARRIGGHRSGDIGCSVQVGHVRPVEVIGPDRRGGDEDQFRAGPGHRGQQLLVRRPLLLAGAPVVGGELVDNHGGLGRGDLPGQLLPVLGGERSHDVPAAVGGDRLEPDVAGFERGRQGHRFAHCD